MSCSICCNDIHEYSMGPCNHKDLCAKCMLHYVLLFNETKCPTCKEELSSVVITTNANKSYEDVVNQKNVVFDQQHNVYFDSKKLANLYQNRLGLRCPLCVKEFEEDVSKPNPIFKKNKELVNHVLTAHKRIFCEICLNHLKVFPYEMLCYTREEYDRHLRRGVNDINLDYRIDPHPACRFCKARIFNEKLLIDHMETVHQHCIFCPPEANAYFNTPHALMQHYKTHHFVCDVPGCLEENLSVFSDRMELMRHKQQAHHQRVVVDLSELAGDFSDSEDEQISSSEIQKAKTFLVEDPSGWSAEEIRKRNRTLQTELLRAFEGNKDKLDRYQNMCGQFLQGTLSPATFHDMSINLLGGKNLPVFSHLISLITEPEKRHVLETIFRAAKGSKSSVLGKEFLTSIGANETRKKQPAKLTTQVAQTSRAYVPHKESAREAAWEEAERAEEVIERSGEGLVILSPEEKEAEELKDIAYPSSFAVSQSMQLQWKRFKKQLNHLCELKSGLVEKKKVVLSELLYSLSTVTMEIMHICDEVLSDRARHESWEGIDSDVLEQLQVIVKDQGDRELYKIEWLPMLHINEKSVMMFQEFYDLFIVKETFVMPPQPVINKNRYRLKAIPARDLNIIREVFVLIIMKIIERLTELTKDVEEEQKRRYQALKIPAKPVKEIDYSTLIKKEKKPVGSVWGKTVVTSSTTSTIKEELFPSLPHTTKPRTINGKLPVINNKKTIIPAPATKSATTSPMGASDGSTSPLDEKPFSARFYTPPLPTASRATSTGASNWGMRKPDQFDLAVENALRQQQEQKKKKGKGNRGVILTF